MLYDRQCILPKPLALSFIINIITKACKTLFLIRYMPLKASIRTMHCFNYHLNILFHKSTVITRPKDVACIASIIFLKVRISRHDILTSGKYALFKILLSTLSYISKIIPTIYWRI